MVSIWEPRLSATPLRTELARDAILRHRAIDPTADTVDLAKRAGIAVGYEVTEALVVRVLDAERDRARAQQ